MGRDGVHQHGRGISRLAAGHIDAHAVQWRNFLAQQGAVFIAVAPALARGLLLRLVVLAHTGGRGLQGFALGIWQAVERRFQFGRSDFQRGHAGCIQAVKALCVLQHRHIAA